MEDKSSARLCSEEESKIYQSILAHNGSLPDNIVLIDGKFYVFDDLENITITNNKMQTTKPTPKTVLCRKCKMEIPKGAKVCAHCGTKQQSIGCGGLIGAFVFVVVVIFVICLIASSASKGAGGNISTSSATTSDSKEFINFEDVQCVTKTVGGIQQTTVSGYCINNTSQTFDYFDITIGFYGKNGVRVSTQIANTLDFTPGKRWFFEVIDLTSGIEKYKIEDYSKINYR